MARLSLEDVSKTHTHAHVFAKVVRAQPMVDENIIKQTETKITFKAVQSWLERTGGYSARTLFWATPPAMWSPLGRFVAKKLMSFTPNASMQVESAIKHLKSQVMTKYRVREQRAFIKDMFSTTPYPPDLSLSRALRAPYPSVHYYLTIHHASARLFRPTVPPRPADTCSRGAEGCSSHDW